MSRDLIVTHPRCWSDAESDAWHRTIPDTMRAFEALARAHPNYAKPLPGNLQARISILIRELAQFCGYSESQMKAIIKAEFYPTEKLDISMLNNPQTKFIGSERYIPKSTMKLTPQEAREVEAHLYNLGAEIGANLSIPQASGE